MVQSRHVRGEMMYQRRSSIHIIISVGIQRRSVRRTLFVANPSIRQLKTVVKI